MFKVLEICTLFSVVTFSVPEPDRRIEPVILSAESATNFKLALESKVVLPPPVELNCISSFEPAGCLTTLDRN